MNSVIKELWHGNIVPQEDSRTNSKEMKELLGYMSRHHEDLLTVFITLDISVAQKRAETEDASSSQSSCMRI